MVLSGMVRIYKTDERDTVFILFFVGVVLESEERSYIFKHFCLRLKDKKYVYPFSYRKYFLDLINV